MLLAQVEVHFYILVAVVGQQNNRRGKKGATGINSNVSVMESCVGRVYSGKAVLRQMKDTLKLV